MKCASPLNLRFLSLAAPVQHLYGSAAIAFPAYLHSELTRGRAQVTGPQRESGYAYYLKSPTANPYFSHYCTLISLQKVWAAEWVENEGARRSQVVRGGRRRSVFTPEVATLLDSDLWLPDVDRGRAQQRPTSSEGVISVNNNAQLVTVGLAWTNLIRHAMHQVAQHRAEAGSDTHALMF